jgi:hypothetical protein
MKASTLKTLLIILGVISSVSAIAQPVPTVSGRTAPPKDTIITLPTSSITLTGTALESDPGHPILDTTWTKTSGPAATITNNSNRMTTTVTGLVQGTYVFTLTATNKQKSASAIVNVKVIPGLLPMELANFNVSRINGGLMLSWQTNMETNNSHFIVQKSNDGSNFTDIASIASKAQNGNSDTQLNYSYQILGTVIEADMHYLLLVMTLLASIALISKLKNIYKSLVLGLVCMFLFSCTKSVSVPTNTISGKTEFRLKQVDLEGNINYSEIKFAH